jgi:hypothetical protein
MKTSLNLSIPKPCSEKWENFTPTQNGGYCGGCFKTVIDFTKMNDDDIVQFFKDKQAHTCGRFRPDQLKGYAQTSLAKVSPGMMLLKAGFLSILFAIISKPASAQNNQPKSKTETVQHPEKQTETVSSDTNGQVTGVVTSAEDGSALPGVNIVLRGTTTGTVTDFNGKFDFPTSLKEGDVLVFSFIGLETKEFAVSKKIAANLNIPLTLSLCMDMIMMGEVEVTGLYGESNGSGFRRWWSKVKSVF